MLCGMYYFSHSQFTIVSKVELNAIVDTPCECGIDTCMFKNILIFLVKKLSPSLI